MLGEVTEITNRRPAEELLRRCGEEKKIQRADTSEESLKISDTQCKNELQSIARRTL